MEPYRGRLLDELRRAAEATPGLVAAYLFGSAGRGAAEPGDWDVALLWEEGLLAAERWRRGEELALRLERARGLDPRPVDLVDLREAPPELQYRILSEGVRAFERDAVARIRFEAMALSMALDFIEWRRRHVERWLRRVADGR